MHIFLNVEKCMNMWSSCYVIRLQYNLVEILKMRNSNSRDRNIKTMVPAPVQKLMKTDIQQPRRDELDKTNYQKIASGKKIESNKILPPKGPVQKIQYIVENNMTESRIHEAKQGLQLLKKKMNSTKGLSQNKIPSNELSEKSIPSLKTVHSAKYEEAGLQESKNGNIPKKFEKKSSYQDEQIMNENPPFPTFPSKQMSITTKNPIERKPAQVNLKMQAPIQPKKDFSALLEEELKKQKNQSSKPISQPTRPSKNSVETSEYPSENIQLIPCRHCERMFGEAAIEKHEKICLKVFMSKRKAFDSAAHRAPEIEEFESGKTIGKKQELQLQKQHKIVPPKKEEEIPKWKAASLAFRANLKAAKGVAISAEEKQASEIAQGLIPCNYCGRKFNQMAAKRHISFCEAKSKQLPKINISKKR